MKTILCYGDSNTWGYIAGSGGRHPYDVRWTGVLQTELGEAYRVVEEGLSGRTTVWDDPIEGHKNGETYLYPCLDTHKPVDLVIIMLGTNDTKVRFSLPASDIAAGMEKLIGIIERSDTGIDGQAPKILLMSPAPVSKLTDLKHMFAGADEKSKRLKGLYADIAKRHGCAFLDIGTVAQTTDVDGIHLDAQAHGAIGKAVADKVREVFGG